MLVGRMPSPHKAKRCCRASKAGLSPLLVAATTGAGTSDTHLLSSPSLCWAAVRRRVPERGLEEHTLAAIKSAITQAGLLEPLRAKTPQLLEDGSGLAPTAGVQEVNNAKGAGEGGEGGCEHGP